MGDLVDDLIRVGDDGVKFFECLKRFIVITQSLVHQAQVIDGFYAICLNADSFKEKLFGSVEVLGNEQAVTFVNQSFRIVAVMLDGQVSEGLSQFEVVLKKIKERNVV